MNYHWEETLLRRVPDQFGLFIYLSFNCPSSLPENSFYDLLLRLFSPIVSPH